MAHSSMAIRNGEESAPLKVLLVSDGSGSAEQRLAGGLRREGFRVDTLGTAAELYRQLFRESYDLILIDSVLPDENGYSVAARLRCVKRVGVEMLATLAELFGKAPDAAGQREFDAARIAAHLREVAALSDFGADGPPTNWRHQDTTAQVMPRV